jgi:TolC family type I secretion outer membrane protein
VKELLTAKRTKRRVRLQRDDRREQILEAAMHLFAEKGFDRTTVDDIADACGVAPGLIYHYFDSKASLLRAILQRYRFPEMVAEILRRPHKPTLEETLTEIAHAYLTMLHENAPFALMLRSEVERNPEVARVVGVVAKTVKELICRYLARQKRAGVIRKDVDAEVFARVFFSTLMEFFIAQHRLTPILHRLSPKRFVRGLVRLLIYGILPHPSAKKAGRWFTVMRRLSLACVAVCIASGISFAQQMTLQECVEIALRTHPQIRLALSQREASVARLRQAQAQWRPELNLTGTQRQQGPTVSFTVPLPPPNPPREISVVRPSTQLLNLELRQSIYDGGRFTANIRSARYFADASDALLQATRAQLTLRVTEAYADVLAAQALEEVARQSVERVQVVLKTAKARLEAGVAPRFDVLRAEAELAAAQEQLLTAQNAVALAKAALNQLLGRPTNAPIEVAPLPEPITPSSEALQTETFLTQALAHRPELRSAEAQIQAAQERVNFAKADKNPLLFLSSNYQRQTETGFSRDYAWSVNLIVQFPIFDSGRRESVLQEQEALLQQALAQREQLQRQIALEVEQAIRNYQVALQRLNTARAALASAEEAFRLAQVRYEAGVGTQVEVLDAQVALTQARANEVRALYDAHKAFARLVYATGLSEAEVRKMLTETMATKGQEMPPISTIRHSPFATRNAVEGGDGQ